MSQRTEPRRRAPARGDRRGSSPARSRIPRIGFVTVTKVETSPDLGHATVWVSVIGGEADAEETLRALEQAMPFVRHELGRGCASGASRSCTSATTMRPRRGTRVLHAARRARGGRRAPRTRRSARRCRPRCADRRREGDADEPAADGVGARASAGPAAPVAAAARARTRAAKRNGRGGRRSRHGRRADGRVDDRRRLDDVAGSRPRPRSSTRIRGGTRGARRQPREPRRGHARLALGVALTVECLGGRATAVCTDAPSAAYDFMPHIDASAPSLIPDVDYDLIVVGDCAAT